MSKLKGLMEASLFVIVLALTGLGQENSTVIHNPAQTAVAVPLVTARATAQGMRFVAPGTVIQLRLEVYNDAGQKVFDTELRGGNVLDWQLQDGAGQRLTTGTYASVLTVKSLSGRLSQRVGSVTVDEKTAVLEAVGVSQLTAEQQQSIGPMESGAGLRVLPENEAAALTAVTHDGTDGQLSRTRGALSFNLGDFFGGTDSEQMRLTEEGNLGLGTAAPKFKLDVAGAVRARAGFVFGNGSLLNVNDKGALLLSNSAGELVPNASGAGTQGRLAKWTDGAGTLGDSVVNDTGTALQLTAAPSNASDTNLLYLNSTNGTTGVLAGSSPSYAANNGPFFAMRGNTYTTIANQRGIFTISAGNVSSPGPLEGVVKFNTGNDQVRMLITPGGDVGIGTTIPTSRLDVAGNINTSTQYNISGERVLGVSSTSNTFLGIETGAGNTGNNNSFFGKGAGRNNQTGSLNSFFGNAAGAKNMTGSVNSFFGQNAGGNNTGGGSNSFFGNSAGVLNTTGHRNTFVGRDAGDANVDGTNNTVVGAMADVGSGSLTNATALGAYARVTQSNSLVLGSISGTNGATDSASVGIGTAAPTERLHVVGNTKLAGNLDVTGNGLFSGNLTVSGAGTAAGGCCGPTPAALEVVGHFTQPSNTAHSAISVDAATDRDAVLYFAENGSAVWGFRNDADANDKFQLRYHGSGTGDDSVARLTVLTDGNVGIGTTTPQRKLHVSDAMRLQPIASPPASAASGDLYFDTSEALCVYVSGAWTKLAGPGTCQ